MRFVHAADIHLGRRRLDGGLPETDFADAFRFIAEEAIRRNADAFVLAGDLFDRPQVEPQHLRQAEETLTRLKEAEIPVIAIAGNHDKAFLNSDEPTWLDYLADDKLLILLTTRFGPDGPQLEPWSDKTLRGAWVDLEGVRFTGAGYLGAATPHKVRLIAERMEPAQANVLLLHAGPDYFVGEGGGFSKDDLEFIRQRVCYLALGHIHKPMLHGGWACNPGSPENCDLHESRYDFDRNGNGCPRGFAWVEIEATSTPPLRHLEVLSNPRRPVLHLDLECTPFGNRLKNGVAELQTAACKLIRDANATPEAAVVICLTGKLNFGRLSLDLSATAQWIQQAARVRSVCLDAARANVVIGGISASVSGSVTREQIERTAIERLVEDEHLWGLEGEQKNIADIFFQLKEGVRLNKSTEELAELAQASPLIGKISVAIAQAMRPESG